MILTHPILHHFQVIADYLPHFTVDREYLSLTQLFKVNP